MANQSWRTNGCIGFLLIAWLIHAVEAAPVDLARLANWDIVVAEDGPASEPYAAEEFQRWFSKASGRSLPIVSEPKAVGGHVFIGFGPAMAASERGFAVDEFGEEDFRIIAEGDTIIIAGGRPRGTLYGVYTFLEDYLGIRFLTAEHTHVPPLAESHAIGPVDRVYRPSLEFRWAYYGEVNRHPEFAARLRVNTVGDDPKLGGRTPQRLINHSFIRQLPTSKYGKDHPEYFALRDGKRLANVKNDSYETQPCLSHPDVLRIVTQEVLKELEARGGRGNVSVSQNDNAKYCQCPDCEAINEREGTPMGSLLHFVNQVADAVAKEYPDAKVGTLAYWYSRRAPKHIKPRPNVQIQLCSIECCLIHPINDPNCPRNVEFCRDMDEWGQICDQIYIWNYNTNFRNYLLPCPNLRVIEPNIHYFLEHNARGIFMQAAGNANGAELSELRAYLIARLLWDPSADGKEVLNEFLDLHYGEAAPPIRRYIERIHDRAEQSGKHHNCFGRLADYGLDDSDAQAGLAAFEEAWKLAKSDAVRSRVERASLCAYRAALEPVWYAPSGTAPQSLVARLRPLAGTFFERCKKFQVDRAQEHSEGISATEQRIRRALGMTDNEPW